MISIGGDSILCNRYNSSPFRGKTEGGPMPHDPAYLLAEKKIEEALKLGVSVVSLPSWIMAVWNLFRRVKNYGA